MKKLLILFILLLPCMATANQLLQPQKTMTDSDLSALATPIVSNKDIKGFSFTIGSFTLSSSVFSFLTGLDQSVNTTSDVTHDNMTITHNIDIGGNASIGGNLTVDNDTTLTKKTEIAGQLSGDGVYNYLGAARAIEENYISDSLSYKDSSYWDVWDEYTVTVEDGFERFVADGALVSTNLLNLDDGTGAFGGGTISNTSGKYMVLTAQVRPYGSTTAQVRLRINDAGGSPGYNLDLAVVPADEWTTIRVETADPAAADINVLLENIGPGHDLAFELKDVAVHERLNRGMLSFGTSICKSAHYVGGALSADNSYTGLYGNTNRIDYTNYGESGATLQGIKNKVLEILTPGSWYPVIIIGGGTNDIDGGGSTTPANMLANMVLAIAEAKLHTDCVIVLTSYCCPAFSTDEDRWNDIYNQDLISAYANDSRVDVIDTSAFITTDDFDPDEAGGAIHLLLSGHTKVYTAIEDIRPLHGLSETYIIPETDGTAVIDSNMSKKTERINIDWTVTKTITDNETLSATYDYRVFCDTTSNVVAVTAPLGAEVIRGQYHLFNTTASNDVKFYPTSPETVDGGASKSFSEGVLMLTFDGVSDWR